jgi:predicted enzyme related to lactoylglutathione lyase
MKRVTGIGGIFFKSKNPETLRAWYKEKLGIDVQEWGGAAFDWKGPHNPDGVGTTAWTLFAADTDHFAPSSASFMINYRVDDLPALLAVLRAEGVQVHGEVEESEFGKFGWVTDPEGNKVELWQPIAGQ